MNKKGGIVMYVARDKNKDLNLFIEKPKRNNNGYWLSPLCKVSLDYTLFPGLRWEDEPIEVVLKPKDEALNEKYWNELRNIASISAMEAILGRWHNISLKQVLDDAADLSVDCADTLIKKLKSKEK